MFTDNEKIYAGDFLDRVVKKLSVMAPQIGANFPSTEEETGNWDPKGEKTNLYNWTVGFWPGMMWLMHINRPGYL